MDLINNDKFLFRKVLTVGPDFHDHRGGIGAVLQVYNAMFNDFYFIPTYKPFDSNFKKSIYFIKQLLVIVKHLWSNEELKIIHIHSSHAGSFYRKVIIFFIAKVYKKKLIFHVHSGLFDTFYNTSTIVQKRLVKWIINNTDVVVCLSEHWKEVFTRYFNIKKIIIINNVVCTPANNISKPSINRPLRFLFLGRIGTNKGIFDIINLLTARREYFSGKLKLLVGGDGETERIELLVKENQLENMVEYLGWVNNEEKAELLLTSDVYILPSYNEGLPVSVLEAMSYGLPIISTGVGGIPEVVKHNCNGLLIEPGNLTEMELAINFFVDNPVKVSKFGANSLRLIKPYTSDFVKKQLLDCYASLLE